MKRIVSLLAAAALTTSYSAAVVYADSGSGSAPTADPKLLPYEEIGDVSGGLAWYDTFNNNRMVYGFIDTKGKIVIPASYDSANDFSEGLASVEKNGKWGYINKTGKVVVPLKYDAVANTFENGYAQVEQNGKWGYIDKTGKQVVSPMYQDSNSIFEGTLGSVKKAGKYGFVDVSSHKLSLPAIYENPTNNSPYFIQGLANVKLHGKWGFIDKKGKMVIPNQYDWAFRFSDGRAAVQKNGKWGFVDSSGKLVITPQYENVGGFYEGLSFVEKNGKWGVINTAGKTVVEFIYTKIDSNFSEGYAFVEKDSVGHVGYIDKQGHEVTPFDGQTSMYGTPFNGGYATVADGGQGSFYIISNVGGMHLAEPVLEGVTNETIGLDSTFSAMDGVRAYNTVNGDTTSSGNLTSQVQVSGTVNINQSGTYTLTYSVADKQGNKVVVKRTIIVSSDSTNPNS